MNKKIFGIISASSSILVASPSFASGFWNNINPFIGANVGIVTNSHHYDIAEKYGVQYSTLGSSLGFAFGANVGIRFLDESYIYHPGVQFTYERISDPATLNVATGYGSVDFDIDAAHNLMGAAFDNYIRIIHDEDGLFNNGFLVFGLDIGRIKSKYEVLGYNLDDDGSFYGVNLEYLAEIKNGLGFIVGAKLLKTTTEALSAMFISKVELRYTF